MWYEIEVQVESEVTVFLKGNSKEEVIKYIESCDDFFVSSKHELVQTNHIFQINEPRVRKLKVNEVKSNPLLK